MKKIIFTTLIVTIGLFACDDFIEHDERGTQNLDNYFQTVEECQVFVNDLYRSAFMISDWRYQATRIANETATDDAWMGNTGQDASSFQPAAHYLIAPNRMGYLSTEFAKRFENISSCNLAINSIPDAPIAETLKNQLVGEALFMRAYNYYHLVNNFGGVPLILTTLSTNEMNKERVSQEEIYAQIESDLKAAIPHVKTSYESTDVGRVSKWACTALLARVSLFQSKWQQAYHYADTTIVNSGHTLEPNFINIWDVNNHNGVESILEMQTSPTTISSSIWLGNELCTFTGARGEKKENFPSNSTDDVMDGWGWGTPTSDLENCYLSEGDDIRRRSTITRCGEAAYGDEIDNPTHIFDLAQNKSGRIIRKFYIPVPTRRVLEDKRFHASLNVPVLRLAEMYLTRAEAAYYQNNSDQAADDMDIVRARVNLAPKKGIATGNNLLRAIWKERRMELAFEDIRLYDIRRQIDPDTNTPVIASLMGANGSFVLYNTIQSTDEYETTNLKELQDKGSGFDINKHLVWPIPQSEIDRSSGKITQNPNY